MDKGLQLVLVSQYTHESNSIDEIFLTKEQVLGLFSFLMQSKIIGMS